MDPVVWKLWSLGCGALVVEPWLWSLDCGAWGVEPWLWDPGLWTLGCGALVVEPGLWILCTMYPLQIIGSLVLKANEPI